MERPKFEVWSVDLALPEKAVDQQLAFLGDAERRAAAARRGAARRRYIVAHAALREILADRLAATPAAIEFRFCCAVCGGAHGKPLLAGDHRLDFSLSHSGDFAVVALSEDGRVGADVERVRSRHYLTRLADRVLLPAERAGWERLPPADRTGALLAAWTVREAHLKALGVGLTRPLARAQPPPEWAAATWPDWPAGHVTSVVAEPGEGGRAATFVTGHWPQPGATRQ